MKHCAWQSGMLKHFADSPSMHMTQEHLRGALTECAQHRQRSRVGLG